MEYLTTHDLIWINEMVTGKVQPYNYVTLEACMAGQYSYGRSTEVVPQAATLLERLLNKSPFLEGNRRTAFIATLTYLNANGYTLTVDDVQAVQAIAAVIEGRTSPLQAITEIVAPSAHALPAGITLRKLIMHECNHHSEALRVLASHDAPVPMIR